MSVVETEIKQEVTPQVTETTHPTAEATPPASAPATSDTPSPQFDPVKYTQETFGFGPDDLKAKLQERQQFEEQLSKRHELNDYELKLVHAHRGGLNLSQFERLQKIDTTTISNEDAVREHYKIKYPDATDTEINAVLKSEYGVGLTEDDIEPETLASKKFKLREASVEAKKFLASQKAEAETKADPAAQQKFKLEQEQKQAEAFQNFSKEWDGAASKLTDLQLPINANENFTYKVPDEVLKSVKEAGVFQQEINGVSRMIIDDKKLGGKENVARLLAIGLSADKIASAIYNEARSKATKETADQYDNKQPLQTGNPHSQQTTAKAASAWDAIPK